MGAQLTKSLDVSGILTGPIPKKFLAYPRLESKSEAVRAACTAPRKVHSAKRPNLQGSLMVMTHTKALTVYGSQNGLQSPPSPRILQNDRPVHLTQPRCHFATAPPLTRERARSSTVIVHNGRRRPRDGVGVEHREG